MAETSKDKKYTLYKGYNFRVEIDGFKEPLSFSKVSSIERSVDTEGFSEGGLNAKVYTLVNGVSSERSMSCERGVMSVDDQESFAILSNYFQCNIAIAILDDSGSVMRYYSMENCTLKSIRLGDLDASQSGILVENLEFVYNEVEVVTSI